jgi:hypothetical protein
MSEIVNLEKDSPFSSTEIWSFYGFSCRENRVERKGFLTFENAVDISGAKCPECNLKLMLENMSRQLI